MLRSSNLGCFTHFCFSHHFLVLLQRIKDVCMNTTERCKNEILRRYCVFTLSLFFISLGVSLITRSLAGTSPISSIPYVMSLHSVLTMGAFIFILNLALMAGQMIMLGKAGIKECKWELIMQLPVSIVFGLFVDLTMWDTIRLSSASLLDEAHFFGLGLRLNGSWSLS